MMVLTAAMPIAARAAQNPHAFMDDPARCASCHESESVEVGGLFTKDIVSLCGDCHSVAQRMSHPVDIRPQNITSQQLPLGSMGTITCLTCHDPHMKAFSPEPFVNRGIYKRLKEVFTSTSYPTYFLRIPNIEGRLCLSCHENSEIDWGYLETDVDFARDFTGSRACERCHPEIFKEWEITPHARTLRDPLEDPEAVAAVFTGQENFNADDVRFIIGVHKTQRYVIERDGELKVARDAWSLNESSWNMSYCSEQSWEDHCAGCHLTGYDPYKDTWVEKGVGCEMCHGPGGSHVRSGNGGNIVNPAAIEEQLARSICASCHTSGHDRTGQFRFPVGYFPGRDLELFYRGLLPHAGQRADTFKGDGTLDDRLRSLGFWFDQLMRDSRNQYRQCGNLYITPAGDSPVDGKELTLAQYCLSCHEYIARAPGHKLRSEKEVNCHTCHEPLKNDMEKPSIHDHKYVYFR